MHGGKPRSPVDNPHVAKTLRAIFAAQDRRNVTNAELAKLSGVAASQISYLRRGKRNAKLNTTEYMAEALGLEIVVRQAVGKDAKHTTNGD